MIYYYYQFNRIFHLHNAATFVQNVLQLIIKGRENTVCYIIKRKEKTKRDRTEIQFSVHDNVPTNVGISLLLLEPPSYNGHIILYNK